MMDPQAGGHGQSYRVAVVGHDSVVAGLGHAATARRLGHAYLLEGPPGVGKRTIARRLAQVLLCPTEPAERRPCGHCRACRLVAAGGHPDLHWLPPPLRIDAVRQLQHQLVLAPSEAGRRVAVLPEVEMASAAAANCLLKTLEEPPASAVLVLTTAEVESVLPTIRSRCRRLQLRPLPVGVVAQALMERWQVPEKEAQLLARLSGGRLGWAVRAVEDPSLVAEREDWLAALGQALGSNRARRLELAAGLAGSSDVGDGLSVWTNWWRDLLLMEFGVEGAVVNTDRLAELRGAAERYTAAEALAALRAIEDARGRLAASTNPQLTLEVLLLELPS